MALLLGLDPGSIKLGWGIIDSTGGRIKHVAHGTLATKKGQALPGRLAFLYAALNEVFDSYAIDSVGVEKVFTAKNPQSALVLGQARGMILLTIGQRKLELAEYTPATVKLAVAGNGRSSKEQLALMVSRLMNVSLDEAGPDASDALAIAICHAHSLGQKKLLEKLSKASS